VSKFIEAGNVRINTNHIATVVSEGLERDAKVTLYDACNKVLGELYRRVYDDDLCDPVCVSAREGDTVILAEAVFPEFGDTAEDIEFTEFPVVAWRIIPGVDGFCAEAIIVESVYFTHNTWLIYQIPNGYVLQETIRTRTLDEMKSVLIGMARR
jgi:hypothetical protein